MYKLRSKVVFSERQDVSVVLSSSKSSAIDQVDVSLNGVQCNDPRNSILNSRAVYLNSDIEGKFFNC
jgi:hypothetical protein